MHHPRHRSTAPRARGVPIWEIQTCIDREALTPGRPEDTRTVPVEAGNADVVAVGGAGGGTVIREPITVTA